MDAPTPEASPHRWIQAKRAGGGGSLPPLTGSQDAAHYAWSAHTTVFSGTHKPGRCGRDRAAATAPSRARSSSASAGRLFCRCRTAIWWRSTMISRSFERPERTASRAGNARNRYRMRHMRSQDGARNPWSASTTEFWAPTRYTLSCVPASAARSIQRLCDATVLTRAGTSKRTATRRPSTSSTSTPTSPPSTSDGHRAPTATPPHPDAAPTRQDTRPRGSGHPPDCRCQRARSRPHFHRPATGAAPPIETATHAGPNTAHRQVVS